MKLLTVLTIFAVVLCDFSLAKKKKKQKKSKDYDSDDMDDMMDMMVDYKGSSVVELTKDNYKKEVQDDSNLPWLIEFYTPGCPACVQLSEDFKIAAAKLKDRAKLGAVNMEKKWEDKFFSKKFKVKYYPTLYLLDADKSKKPKQV